jgi:hypothetical protein
MVGMGIKKYLKENLHLLKLFHMNRKKFPVCLSGIFFQLRFHYKF